VTGIFQFKGNWLVNQEKVFIKTVKTIKETKLNRRKRRKGTFPTTGRGKAVPLYLPSRLFQAREEKRKPSEAT